MITFEVSLTLQQCGSCHENVSGQPDTANSADIRKPSTQGPYTDTSERSARILQNEALKKFKCIHPLPPERAQSTETIRNKLDDVCNPITDLLIHLIGPLLDLPHGFHVHDVRHGLVDAC